jgi:hypothetical protein
MRFDARQTAASFAASLRPAGLRVAIVRLGRAIRRRGPAFGVAALVNALALAAIVLSVHLPGPASDRILQVSLVSPFEIEPRAQPHRADKRPLPPTQPQWRAVRPNAVPPPSLAPAPAVPAPHAPQPPSRWTFQPGAPAVAQDTPSLKNSLRVQGACATGEIARLSTEAKEKCLARWGRFKPPADGIWRRPPPRDPGGEFARAAAEAEEKRRPMQQSPIHACAGDSPGGNLGMPCAH